MAVRSRRNLRSNEKPGEKELNKFQRYDRGRKTGGKNHYYKDLWSGRTAPRSEGHKVLRFDHLFALRRREKGKRGNVVAHAERRAGEPNAVLQ